MEIKEVKSATVAALEGGMFAVGGALCPTWSAALKALAAEMGVQPVPRHRPPKSDPRVTVNVNGTKKK